MPKSLIASLALAAFVSAGALAQNGKLTGRILDAKTGEPLIGANVILQGTSYGGAADIDGRYVVLNVPPGDYDVRASMVGYASTIVTGVSVFIDRTTEQNFELQDESVQLEQVVVVADKAPVVKDRTSTSTNIGEEQLRAAPLEGLRNALDLTAGFQRNEKGGFSIRGSGSHEVNFQINGVEQTNSNTSAPGSFDTEKANNSWKYDVNPLGVKQLQLITGGFSAEYGNAQAGVVKVVMKDGSPKFSGEVRVEYRPAGQYHWGPYLYDKSNWEWEKWGTLDAWMAKREQVAKELKLTERYAHLKDSDPDLYNEMIDKEIAWAHQVWVENHEPSDGNVFGIYDYRQGPYVRTMFGFGGPLGADANKLKFFLSGEFKSSPTRLPTPERNQVYQNYILNVTHQPAKDHKLKAMASYQHYVGGIWSGSSDIRWSGLAFSPPGFSTKYIIDVDPVREEQTIAQSLQWVYTIDEFSFFEARVSHQSESYELPYKYLAGFNMEVDRLDSLNDPSGTVLMRGSWWEEDYFRAPIGFSTNYYQDSRTENLGVKADYTSQINSANLIKAGAVVNYWDMLNNGVNSSFQANSYVARNGFADYYHAYPINLAAYAQDKMEYEGMIANVGVRVESYNFQTDVPVDRTNVLYPGTEGPSGEYGNPETEPSEWKILALPRFGVSFPIGEATAFRIQYGHFASMPIFTQALSRKTWVGWQGVGNPNLDPKVTINYEFGLQQVVGENHRLDVALYYNDRASQIGRQNVASYTGSRNQPAGFSSDNTPLYYYWSFDNNAFGSTVGFEAIFETIRGANWSYRLSYSLSQTTAGNYGPSIVYPDDTRGYLERNYAGEFLASWDRTHNFRGLLQYNWREDEGISIFGFRPFENSSVSLAYMAQSGTPYTYVTTFDLRDVVYNRRYPLESSVDLSFLKDATIGGYKIVFGVRVMNLFDNKHLTPMSTSEDMANWNERGVTLMDPGDDPTRLGYLVAPYRAYRNIPRQVFFTVGFGF